MRKIAVTVLLIVIIFISGSCGDKESDKDKYGGFSDIVAKRTKHREKYSELKKQEQEKASKESKQTAPGPEPSK